MEHVIITKQRMNFTVKYDGKMHFLPVFITILIKYVTYVVKHASYDKPHNNSLVL